MKPRERLSFEPSFEGAVVGYAKNYLIKNVWRVQPLYELDDLLQEAFLLFVGLQQRYTFKNDKHFMSMWKRCLHNWFVNLALHRTRRREVAFTEENDLCTSSVDKVAEWHQHVAEAPEPVKRLIDAVESRKRRPRRHSKRSGIRETTNTYLCRIAGVKSSVPLRSMLMRWLYE